MVLVHPYLKDWVVKMAISHLVVIEILMVVAVEPSVVEVED
jgi:hypothetical protein